MCTISKSTCSVNLFRIVIVMAGVLLCFTFFSGGTATALELEAGQLAVDDQTITANAKPSQAISVKAAVRAKGITNVIRQKLVTGKRYLLLPSYANLRYFHMFQPGGKALYLSSKKNGTYVKTSRTKPVDISTYPRDAQGAYRLFVKTSRKSAPFVVRVMKSANIRTMYLVSKDPKKQGRSYIEASPYHTSEAEGAMALIAADGDVVYNGKLDQIKGRGNSTWGEAVKKPYQIKLADKASLLDGTEDNAAKTWVLLANAFDNTLSRNYLAYKTALAIGMKEAPECEFVDLYYDGEYLGNYLLCEKVQVKGGRVDIAEIENESLDDTDIEEHDTETASNRYGYEFQYVKDVKPAAKTGGYLIELDNGYYSDERSWFETSVGYFVLKSPEDASYSQVKYISEFTQAVIDELSSNRKPVHADLKSFAQAHFVNELAKNADFLRHSSTYFYKDKNESVLHAGPVWDFDAAFGGHVYQLGIDYSTPKGFACKKYGSWYLNNKHFASTYKKLFDKVMIRQAKGLVGKGKQASTPSIASVRHLLAKSVAMERMFHPAEKAQHTIKAPRSWKKGMDNMEKWLNTRISWLQRATK